MNTLTIIDKGLADYATLVAALPEGSEILWLDTDRDGIAQIADYLATPTREASGAPASRRHEPQRPVRRRRSGYNDLHISLVRLTSGMSSANNNSALNKIILFQR